MKYSKNFERDYKFYIDNINIFNFAGIDINNEINVTQDNNSDINAKQCFHEYDSVGKRDFITNEKDLLVNLIIAKKSVNLYMRMYADSIVDGTLFINEFITDIVHKYNVPLWFILGVIKQSRKKYNQNYSTFDVQNSLLNLAIAELDFGYANVFLALRRYFNEFDQGLKNKIAEADIKHFQCKFKIL